MHLDIVSDDKQKLETIPVALIVVMTVSFSILIAFMLVYPYLFTLSGNVKFMIVCVLLGIFLFTSFLIVTRIGRVLMYDYFPQRRRKLIIE